MSTIQVKRMTSASAPNREAPPGGRSRPWSGLTRFTEETAGDVAIIFGLMAMAMFMFIGAAVDIGRWLNARDQTIAAVDAAVLAGGRTLQSATNPATAQADAIAMAKRYYDQTVANRLSLKSDTIQFVVGDNGTSVTITGNGEIRTPFMALAGISELQLLQSSGFEHSKAMLAVGGNAEMNLEISMMLDVSGSMGEGTKLQEMKDAAKDLVNIVVWADQGSYTSKVAIVPFSGDVRPPAGLWSLVTDPTWPDSRPNPNGDRKANAWPKTSCVAERSGTDSHMDTLATLGTYVMRTYTSSGNCSTPLSGSVMPMSNDKTALTNKINGLTLGGGTAGHIGTAWAYYMISPKWASILPLASKPVAYTAPKNKKIAILMTDGEYNYTYGNTGIATNSGGGNANSNSSAGQALAICNQMKTDNIEVYTVGFDLQANQTALNMLKNCASDASKAYSAADGDQLKAAFRDIALKISTLYLMK